MRARPGGGTTGGAGPREEGRDCGAGRGGTSAIPVANQARGRGRGRRAGPLEGRGRGEVPLAAAVDGSSAPLEPGRCLSLGGKCIPPGPPRGAPSPEPTPAALPTPSACLGAAACAAAAARRRREWAGSGRQILCFTGRALGGRGAETQRGEVWREMWSRALHRNPCWLEARAKAEDGTRQPGEGS